MIPSKPEVITRSRNKAHVNVHAPVTSGFGFTYDCLKKWREIFKPITECSKAGVALTLLVFTFDINSVIACSRHVRPLCRDQT